MRSRRAERAAVALGLLLLGGCALPPSDSRGLELDSRSYGFVDEVLRGEPGVPQRIDAELLLPAPPPAEGRTGPPYPAVVLLHSSIGQGSQDWAYARRLSEAGFAVLAVDSFGPRGVEKTVRDHTLVSEASMLADAYAALAYLAADPRVDPRRIAVLGFSKGGIVALYSALASLADRLALDEARFAAHVAYYPWCGLRPLALRTTGAPVLVESGTADDVAPPALCAELLAAIRRADPASRVWLSVHPDARHAFDHPLLSWFGRLPVGGRVPGACRFAEAAPGRFLETTTGEAADAESLAGLLQRCGHDQATAGGNEAAAAAAWQEVVAFLERELGPLGPSAR